MRKIIALLFLLLLSSCSKEKTLNFKAENAEGLTEESILTLNGFEIGTIDNIELNNQGMLLIKSTVKKAINLPIDSEFSIEEQGLLGSKMIKLKLGKSKKMISENDTIQLKIQTDDSLHIDLKKAINELSGSNKNDSILKELKRLNKNLEKQQNNK